MSSSHLPGDAAPLPSPTSRAIDAASYFNNMPLQAQAQQQHALSLQQSSTQTQQKKLYPSKQHSTQASLSSHTAPTETQQTFPEQKRMNSGDSSSSEASLHLKNATLLAEAAGRAQVDCTTRDIDEMEL